MPEEEPGDFWLALEPVRRAGEIHGLRDATMSALNMLGFSAAYFLAPIVADPRIARIMTNCGYPPEWAEQYRETDYLHDPLPQVAMTRRSAFVWPEGIRRGDLTDAQLAYLDALPKWHMGRGIAVPCFGPYARVGFVGISLARGPECFEPLNVLKAEVCARLSFERYTRLLAPFGEDPPSLSQREIEVMQLVAEGKSNAVIAQLLEIAPSSVDVYVKRIFSKLGVSDRTNASVRALSLGLVVSGAYPGETRER